MSTHTAVRAIALCLCVALAATACNDSGAQTAEATKGGPPGAGGPGGGGRGGMGGGGARVMPVTVGQVTRGSIARTATVSGVVEPIRSIAVNAQLAGALLQVLAEEGVAVRAGTPLARVDDREIAAQLAAAEASFQVAEAAYKRAEQLRERKVITIPEYERDRTAYAAAKAQYDQLRTRLGYATVRAPINGVVTEKHVEAGDVVSTNARLFTLADMSNLVVRVGVSELDVIELKPGDPVHINLDAVPGRELTGRIRRIFPAANPTTRLVPVEVVIDPASAQLVRPGFLARVSFALSTHNDVLLIPASAIIGAQGNEAVFTVADGKAVRRTIETGLNSRGMVEVKSGLAEGEEIVIVGGNTLRDGMSIRAVGANGDTSAAAMPAPQGKGGKGGRKGGAK